MSVNPRAHNIVLVDLPHSDYRELGYANSRDDYEHRWVVLEVDVHRDELLAIPTTTTDQSKLSRYKHTRELHKKHCKPPSTKHSVLLGDEIALLSFRQLAGEWKMGTLTPIGVDVLDALYQEMGGDKAPVNFRLIEKLEALDAAAKAAEDDDSSDSP